MCQKWGAKAFFHAIPRPASMFLFKTIGNFGTAGERRARGRPAGPAPNPRYTRKLVEKNARKGGAFLNEAR